LHISNIGELATSHAVCFNAAVSIDSFRKRFPVAAAIGF